jgi:hypothetical protein
MAKQIKKGKTDLDVIGFLSVMSIVTGLICMILFVIALRIAMNPKLMKIVSFKLFSSTRADTTNPKVPSYVDCQPDQIVLYPGKKSVSWDELRRPENAFTQLLDKIQKNASQEYIIVMVRPESVRLFRSVRAMIGERPIDVGYDVIDKDFQVNWDEALKQLGVAIEPSE